MPAPAWEKLSDFFSTNDFADECVVHFQAGGQRTVVGNFDDPYLDAQAGEYALDTSDPRFMAPATELAGIKKYDTAVIGGITYDILGGPQPDGTGLAVLKLAPQ